MTDRTANSGAHGHATMIARLNAYLDSWYQHGGAYSHSMLTDCLAYLEGDTKVEAALRAAPAPPTHPIAAFLKAIASYDLGAPEIVLEEDSDVAFDWGNQLTVSLSVEGRIGWAALIPPLKSHGHFFITETW